MGPTVFGLEAIQRMAPAALGTSQTQKKAREKGRARKMEVARARKKENGADRFSRLILRA